VHGFDEFFGNLYHLNAEEEPELPDYPNDPAFLKAFGPRGVLHSKATATENPLPPDPRLVPGGKQIVEDTGPLTAQRLADVVERIDGSARISCCGPCLNVSSATSTKRYSVLSVKCDGFGGRRISPAAENQVGCVTGRCLRSGLWQRV
jgi:hypothetical protein